MTIFDLSKIKENDEVLVEGTWRKVNKSPLNQELRIQYGKNRWDKINIQEVKIEGHKKYVPHIRYGGAVCDVESFIINDSGQLVFLELTGAAEMVKSVTSVLMQGRMKMNDHTVDADFGFFQIYKAGNKRKIVNLEEGLAHSIVYHAPSISEVNFNIIMGTDKDNLLNSFAIWMEASQPLPYPQKLTAQIFEKLKSRDKLKQLKTFNMEAIEVDLSIFEDDFNDLTEIILEVCKEHGLIAENAKPIQIKKQFPLPKSNYLRPDQVQKIYDTLNKMPKTYQLENEKIKPIGLKLFSPNMTLYVVEADKGDEEDEYENMHTQCYGYIKNESDPQMSEWGYINIPYYLKMDIPVGVNAASGRIGSIKVGFEQDLHFENMYINQKGQVGTLEELQQKTA